MANQTKPDSVLCFDGACIPKNPGGTATWAMTVSACGRTIEERFGVVGSGPEMSCNVGEWAAARRCLEYILDHQLSNCEVRGDSQIVISKLISRRPSKGLCFKESLSAINILKQIKTNIVFTWIRRELNWHCDSLTKKAYFRGLLRKPVVADQSAVYFDNWPIQSSSKPKQFELTGNVPTTDDPYPDAGRLAHKQAQTSNTSGNGSPCSDNSSSLNDVQAIQSLAFVKAGKALLPGFMPNLSQLKTGRSHEFIAKPNGSLRDSLRAR